MTQRGYTIGFAIAITVLVLAGIAPLALLILEAIL